MAMHWLFRRRKLWINTSAQLRILLCAIAGSVILGIFLSWYTFTKVLRIIAEKPQLYDPRQAPKVLLMRIWPDLLPGALLITGLVLLCIVGLGLIISHQIAGPIYRIRMTLSEMRAGRFATRVKFRKMDSLKEMESELNETLQALDERDKRLEAELRKAAKALDSIGEHLEKLGLPQQDEQLVREAREMLQKYLIEEERS